MYICREYIYSLAQPTKSFLSNKRNQGSLEKWVTLGLGMENTRYAWNILLFQKERKKEVLKERLGTYQKYIKPLVKSRTI